MYDKDTHILEEAYDGMLKERFGTDNSVEKELNIELSDPNTEQIIPVRFIIKYTVDPSETEDGYTSYKGGVDIDSITSDDKIIIDNNVFPAETDVNAFFPYMDWWIPTDPRKNNEMISSFWDSMNNQIQNSD